MENLSRKFHSFFRETPHEVTQNHGAPLGTGPDTVATPKANTVC